MSGLETTASWKTSCVLVSSNQLILGKSLHILGLLG